MDASWVRFLLRHKNLKGWVAAVFVASLFAFFLYCEYHLEVDKKYTTYFYTQMLTGTSWPEWKQTTTDYAKLFFAISAVIHTLIAAGPLFGVVWLIVKYVTNRSAIMTTALVLSSRDASIKLEIKQFLGTLEGEQGRRIAQALDHAFERGHNLWQDDLNDWIGPEKAAEVMANLNDTKISD